MKKPIIPVLIAILLAIGAGVAVYAFARSADERAVAQQQPVPVLVSAALVPAGTTLQAALADGLIEQSVVPQALRPVTALAGVTQSTAALVATADLPAGQVILDGAFAADLPDIAPIDIPDGQLAVSVLLEAPAKVGSFLRPGSSIAVYDTALQRVCGCTESGGQYFTTAGSLTCTVKVGKAVYFTYVGITNTHQMLIGGFYTSPPRSPSNATQVDSYEFRTTGTFTFQDGYTSIGGTFIVVP
ncbi:MAG: hypothetical protein EBZ67_15655 [Chitinophagia bacterium]|nr:hypothetical protein [Chitinophagia bacterium]